MNISIFGLGYVGAVALACLARDGHKVIGVDVDAAKLELIRQGRSPIIEEGMPELIAEIVRSGRVHVTDDVVFAVNNSDLSFVCVGTPSRSNGSQDLTAVERLSTQLGTALRSRAGYHVFVIRSTVVPGTLEDIVIPIIERHSEKKCGQGFGICFQPEFLREGSSISDFDRPPFAVVGADSERSLAMVREVFGRSPAEFHVCTIRTAEMLKYTCNMFHALKITFANEVGRICQALQIDSHEVMDLVGRDTQLNISTAYLKPGFAYGGSCLPKDLRAMRHLAGRLDVVTPLLSAIGESNQIHLEHAIDVALSGGRNAVGMLGLSFKAGTDDLRESPLVAMAERFIGKGLRLKIYDPAVSVSRLVGANRRYIAETIPHIGSLMSDDLGSLIDDSQVLVVGLRTDAVVRELHARCRPDHFILDLIRLADSAKLKGTYRGVCW